MKVILSTTMAYSPVAVDTVEWSVMWLKRERERERKKASLPNQYWYH